MRNKPQTYDPKDIYVVKTVITSDYKILDNLLEPIRYVEYYLARKKNDCYYEFFSGVDIENVGELYNTPDIVKEEPIELYLKELKINRSLDKGFLFGFITQLNATQRAKDILD